MTTFLAAHLWQSTLVAGVAALLTLLLRANHARTRYVIWLTASAKFLVPFGALVALGRQFTWRTSEPLTHPALVAVETVAAPLTTFSAPDFGAVAAAVSAVAAPASAIDAATLAVAIWITGGLLVLGVWCVRWQQLKAVLQSAIPLTDGRELQILRRLERACGCRELALLASTGSLEPGVIGCLDPVILWPSAISRRMSDEQLEAILLHELAHVKRRDNLLALMHMFVQALFWFHPLVWWIGARLVDERERACDEEVVRLGADPHQYAEAVLRTCEYAVESPLACVAGITGSDLRRRVTAIVGGRRAASLGRAKLALLTTIGVLAAVGPIAAGALTRSTVPTTAIAESVTAQQPHIITMLTRQLEPSADSRAEPFLMFTTERRRLAGADTAALPAMPATRQAPATPDSNLKFEVASIKLRKDTGEVAAVRTLLSGSTRPGALFMHAGSIRVLLQRAYGIPFVQQIGGPDWIREDTYIINAKAPDDVPSTPAALNTMIRALLADRFQLVVREELREVPIYALTLARGDGKLGPKLQTSTCPPSGGGQPPTFPPNQAGLKWEQGPRCGQMQSGRGLMTLGGFPIGRLTELLQFTVGRPVVDRTGLTANYVLEMNFSEQALGGAAGIDAGPSLFTAIQEQLGLKLESERAPMKVLVIDSIQRPTED